MWSGHIQDLSPLRESEETDQGSRLILSFLRKDKSYLHPQENHYHSRLQKSQIHRQVRQFLNHKLGSTLPHSQLSMLQSKNSNYLQSRPNFPVVINSEQSSKSSFKTVYRQDIRPHHFTSRVCQEPAKQQLALKSLQVLN